MPAALLRLPRSGPAPAAVTRFEPLFAIVATVVTDAGGGLTHCAVVAREPARPAVVGSGIVPTVLAAREVLEIDGECGIVRVIDEGGPR